MEPIETRLIELEKKVDAMSVLVKRLYVVFLTSAILTVLGFLIPIIGLAFVIPQFISNYSSLLGQ